MIRKARAVWRGTGRDGAGELTTDSGVLKETAYSYRTRFQDQPGTNPDSAVTTISNLAMAQLRRLPPGTLPPVVLKFDASSLPVCLLTFQGDEQFAAHAGEHRRYHLIAL